ncbi:MAG: hypothetical protein ABW202_22710 [Duganella sp.]
MLNIFYRWAPEALKRLPHGVAASLTSGGQTADPAARLDFDAPTRIGRITCWDSGSFYAEVLDVESGDNLLGQHGRFDSAASLSQLLQTLLDKLHPASL